jgi:hypothetical protein
VAQPGPPPLVHLRTCRLQLARPPDGDRKRHDAKAGRRIAEHAWQYVLAGVQVMPQNRKPLLVGFQPTAALIVITVVLVVVTAVLVVLATLG